MPTVAPTHLSPRSLLPASAGVVLALLRHRGLLGLIALRGGHAEFNSLGEALAALDASRLGTTSTCHAAVRPLPRHPPVGGRETKLSKFQFKEVS